MSFILGYFIVGFAVYLALVHYSLEDDRELPEDRRWVIIIWPMIYVFGLVDLIDYLIKESKKNE